MKRCKFFLLMSVVAVIVTVQWIALCTNPLSSTEGESLLLGHSGSSLKPSTPLATRSIAPPSAASTVEPRRFSPVQPVAFTFQSTDENRSDDRPDHLSPRSVSSAADSERLTEEWEQLLGRAYGGSDANGSNPPVNLSTSEVELLQQLPMACTTELLGNNGFVPDHSQFTAPQKQPPTAATTHAAQSPSRLSAAPASNIVPQSVSQSSNSSLDNASGYAEISAPDSESGSTPIDTGFVHHSWPAAAVSAVQELPAVDPHRDLFANTPFPSAVACAECHQQIFDEWASSSHAYASVSPMFHRFEDTISKLTRGTIGYFCMRCHAPVATIMEQPRHESILEGPRVFREGVTCVACHRVKESYTKTNGERRIEPGDVFAPVYGSGDGHGVEIAAKYKEFFKVKTDPHDQRTAQPMHARSIQFEQLSQSDVCMSCHQVAVPPGVKLEVVWDQYRASPAYRDGVTCQDCHMGKVPGVDAGYSVGPAAVISGRVVNAERKHSNHAFYGPGYSIAHPGLFPHNRDADRWTPQQWLSFDWRAGWGTEEFERQVATHSAIAFPPEWRNVDDRFDARQVINDNLKRLQYKRDLRRQVMENGSKIDGPFFKSAPGAGRQLTFHYVVTNLNPGHNLPSGSLGAQPQLWLNVALIDPAGNRLWESGYLDSRGDLADIHSQDVLDGIVPLDRQLFNLQTKFLTSNVKGTDREMYLPINVDFDQLPFIRPAAQPVTVLNHPPTIRMEAHSLPPLGSKKACYSVPAELLQGPGTYRLTVRMRSRMEPIYFMDYCESTPEMIQAMNEGILDVHMYSVAFEVQ